MKQRSGSQDSINVSVLMLRRQLTHGRRMSERGNVACCVAKMQEFETVRGQRRLAICLRANFFRNLAFLLENRKIVSKFREVFRKKKKK